MKKQNSNQNGNFEKMVVLVKTFIHYHYKSQLFQLSCKLVKARHNQFFFQNVQNNEIFEIVKMFKNMLKVKFDAKTNSDMENSMMVSILYVLD